jgi:sugar phosphate isomerase/epimerase
LVAAAETPYAQAVPIGGGIVDYRSFFAGLREGGFADSIAYEMRSPLLGGGTEENMGRYAARFLAYLRE